jgi:hypothetical protein
MKGKAIFLGLILIAILFCATHHSHARCVGPPYYYSDPISYPSEHPWQDVESPPTDDIVTQQISSVSVIVIGPAKMILIRSSQIKPKSEITGPAPKMIEFGHPTKKGND